MTSKKSERPTAKKSATKKSAAKGRAEKRPAGVAEGRATEGVGVRTAAAKEPAAPKRPAKKAKARATSWPSRLASKYASKYAAAALASSAAVWCRAGVSRRDLDNFLTAKEDWVGQLLRPRAGLGVWESNKVTSPSPDQNVVGISIGEKVVGGRYTGIMAMKFLVRVKYGRHQLTPSDLLPESVGGLQTDIEQVGTIRRSQAVTPDPRAMLRPAPPGSSVGFRDPADPLTAGTLGAIVRRGTQLFILSNNHVLVPTSQNSSTVGIPVFQPAPFDASGPVSASRIGKLSLFVRLHADQDNIVDCAIAELDSPTLATNSILGIGAPQGAAVAQTMTTVEKFGRTTRFSTGTIKETNATVLIEYPGIGTLLFRNQIRITGHNSLPFSDEGDSGSLIVERTTGRAVGLLFGITQNGVMANHIGDVLQVLNVSLA